jgi:hypothetical protein
MHRTLAATTLLGAVAGHGMPQTYAASFGADPCEYPNMCPGKLYPRADKQTWMMNASTIIMPCNNSGYTDPSTTKGWGIVDFDWSNAKGKGTADGWVKHSPMDDEEMLFKQVQMTTSATEGTTVWVYRCSVYAYPWYTSVRTILDDPAYADWFVDFKPEGPWHAAKCDSNFNPPKCSNHYHMLEQTPGFPHGDGDCLAPGCDCGNSPCAFYLWNHSSTTIVKGQSFRDWFIDDYVLNKVGMSPLVSGFFWDDFWPLPNKPFPDSRGGAPGGTIPEDTGLTNETWGQITDAYNANMEALRVKTLAAGKFAWQLMWTGGLDTSVGNTEPKAIVQQANCAAMLRTQCTATAAPQTRAMMYGLQTNRTSRQPSDLTDLHQDLANFLLIRGPFAWLGHGWHGCSKDYPFPEEFNEDYGEPVNSGEVCKETGSGTGVFTREYTKASVQMDCNQWVGTITMK